MEQREIIEGDTLCSRFLGLPHKEVGTHAYPIGIGWGTPENLKYHKSWDWLMSVVQRIESLPEDPFHGRFGVHISSNSCTIQGTNFRSSTEEFCPAYFIEATYKTKIEATWLACIAFINFYNEGCPKR